MKRERERERGGYLPETPAEYFRTRMVGPAPEGTVNFLGFHVLVCRGLFGNCGLRQFNGLLFPVSGGWARLSSYSTFPQQCSIFANGGLDNLLRANFRSSHYLA